MKTLIVALNSKYIHSSLAAWYLKASCGPGCGDVFVREYTINENMERILSSIYSEKPDIVAFSCYIWNISHVHRLASSLKKVSPGTIIVLGGPEVSYDAEDILAGCDYVDYVMAGEGERSFPGFLSCMERAGIFSTGGVSGRAGCENLLQENDQACSRDVPGLKSIDGLAWRSDEGIVVSAPAVIEDLDSIPSPYTNEMLSALDDRIVYFESSRGCPFSCSYCLSSVSGGVRYFSLERVFRDLDRLVFSGVKQVKFVDRTFNASRSRAKDIIRHILKLSESGSRCNFHFEVGADLFDEEMLNMLENSPKGLIQIEAGIQSTNNETLVSINRKTDLKKALENLERIVKSGNVHVHADLIAGLPYEDYCSFRNSFNGVYKVKPHHLQVGFLKFLKGTDMRKRAYEDGFVFNDCPPYEVLGGKHIGFDELIVLKDIAFVVDKYYNSGRFAFSLDYVISRHFSTAFDFYEKFSSFLKEEGFMDSNWAARELYMFLYRFGSGLMNKDELTGFCELLRLDFLASDRSGSPPGFLAKKYEPGFRDRCYSFLKDTGRIDGIIPGAENIPVKLLKKVHFEQFRFGSIPIAVDNAFVHFPCKDTVAIQANKECTAAHVAASDSPRANEPVTLLFCYFSRDKVTGRYPFFRVNI
ncbi:MAG: B12-binding domain-containing radical SAM protein [Acetivibrionales bacterium]